MKHYPITKSSVILLTLLLAVSLLTGCVANHSGTTSDQSATKGAAYPLPTYQVGTTYVWADGSWDRVVAVSANEVEWQNHRGHTKTVLRDFTFRPVRWQTSTREGSRKFREAQFYFGSKPFSLWPLSLGNEASYYEDNNWQKAGEPPRSYTAYWNCRVEKNVKVSVPAGKFDGIKVHCGRYSASNRSVASNPREYRTWYYVPEISHWVAYERDYFGENKRFNRKRLTAILPGLDRFPIPATEKKRLENFYQQALSDNQDGQSGKYRVRGGGVEMEITPLQSFTIEDVVPCRQYKQSLNVAGVVEPYFGIACRRENSDWRAEMRAER